MPVPKRKREQTIEVTADEWALIRRHLAMSRDVLERYARLAEEYDGNRLANEEIRELIKELVEESGRFADGLSGRMDRLERYTILVRMVGSNQETLQIEGSVSRENIERALRRELVSQQDLILQYQSNIDRLRIRIAKFGESTALLNELDDYQKQVGKANEAIARIRENLR